MGDDEDRRRFELLALPHLDAAYNLARWLTHDDHDAQDVVQDALMRALRYMGSFRGDNARAWLLQIVRHTCFSWLRENRPAQRLSLDDGDDPAHDVAAPVAWQRDRLLDDVVASHVRSTLGQHRVDVASSDHHTVKPWLSARLDFSPPVHELALPGSVLLGGRVDYLDGRPVAALVYRQGARIVNTFVWPGKRGEGRDGKAQFGSERGFQTAHWSQGGMTHWVISDVNRDEFRAVVRAVQLADGEGVQR
jgi:RNA polymerase sigma factor (sigma-70 family)